MLTAGSLFSGAGWLSLAVEQAMGATTRWVSDVEPAANAVLARRFPSAANLGDITAVDWAAVEPVDIIEGGYPCQPFSTAGRRMGQDDDRHLWPYVRDALAIMRPKFAVFENVRGHLSLGFDEVARDLHQLGYDIEWRIVRASDIGACHQRARLFILGVNREYRVRSRTDRRGGLDWNPADSLQLSGSDANHDVRQGHPCPTCNAGAVRGSDRATKGASGNSSSDDLMDGIGRTCRGTDLQAAAPFDREARSGRLGAGVPCDADGRPEATQSWAVLDRGDARPGQDVDAAHSGSEPARSGSRAAGPAGRCADCGLPLGLVVGAGGQLVRPGGVRGPVPNQREDDLGPRVRASDVGACHQRARVFVLAWHPARVGVEGHRPEGVEVATPPAGARVSGRADHGLNLLPTPRTSDTNGVGTHGQGGIDLRTAVAFLPTPTAAPCGTQNGGTTVGDVVYAVDWGKYADAIRRHTHMLGRPHPSPTITGARGNPKLSAHFTEWMMCAPDGWIGDLVDDGTITNNAGLKLSGNGVVIPQAVHAIRGMLARAFGGAA